jgi:hypothetical protein
LGEARIRRKFKPDDDVVEEDSNSVREVGGDGDRMTPEQEKAIDYFIEHEAKLYPVLLRALAKYAEDFRVDWVANDQELADKVVPSGMKPEQVAERISFSTVYVSRRSLEGMAYVEVSGECTWDLDHGFCAVLHKDRLVDLSQQGYGWTDKA